MIFGISCDILRYDAGETSRKTTPILQLFAYHLSVGEAIHHPVGCFPSKKVLDTAKSDMVIYEHTDGRLPPPQKNGS